MRRYLWTIVLLCLAVGSIGCTNLDFGTNVHQNSPYQSPMERLTEPCCDPTFWGVTGTN